MYCEDSAAEAVASKIERLRGEPKHRKIVVISDRVGLDKIQLAMCKPHGPMHLQFSRTGGYRVCIDDLRRCTNDFYRRLRLDELNFRSFRC